MYRRMLLATDGSALARGAVEHGLALARALGSEVLAVTVTERWWPLEMAVRARRGQSHPVEDFEALVEAAAGGVMAETGEAARRAGLEVETCHVRDQPPAIGIVETATARDCDLIVMGSHGRRGFRKLMLGSVAAETLATSPVPVLVVKQEPA